MGNYNSQVVTESEWEIKFTLNKGSTTITYLLKSDTPRMVKTVKGLNNNPITFSVDPTDFQMTHGIDPSGTDGEAEDLRKHIHDMGVLLEKRFLVESTVEETVEDRIEEVVQKMEGVVSKLEEKS